MADFPTLLTRRRFFHRAGCAALGTSGLVNALSHLRLMGGAAALQDAPEGPDRALVCLFLFGGNDANNLIVPREGPEYNAYAATRGAVALPQAGLLPVNPNPALPVAYGLHPACSGLKELFDSGRLAFLANVGTLVAPITRSEYLAKSVAVPPQLFSHNDQQVHWQTSRPDSVSPTGWGGRMADLLHATYNNSQISMSISLAGSNVFQVGSDVFLYQVGTSGSVGLSATSGSSSQANLRRAAITSLLAQASDNLFQKEFSDLSSRAIANDALLKTILPTFPERNLAAYPAGSRLGGQLRMILRLIEARSALGLRRQLFFCSLGGWDTHDDQLNDQQNLLGELSGCVKAFSDACTQAGLADQVTLFSASDFGRSYGINGDGTDHGWGNHQFVVGGSVNGGRFYGTMPTLAINGPDDTSKGRWIPTTSVDEYAATLARWFGVDDNGLTHVLPNLGRFATRDLGFLRG